MNKKKLKKLRDKHYRYTQELLGKLFALRRDYAELKEECLYWKSTKGERIWTNNPPTEPGTYWYVGQRPGHRKSPVMYRLVKVRKSLFALETDTVFAQTMTYITGGHHFTPGEDSSGGIWTPADLPEGK